MTMNKYLKGFIKGAAILAGLYLGSFVVVLFLISILDALQGF